MEANKTATPKSFGVSTTERSIDGFRVEIVDARLNIGEISRAQSRHPCTVDELWDAARKLNAHDDLVKALQATKEYLLSRRIGNEPVAIAQAAIAAIDAALAAAGAA